MTRGRPVEEAASPPTFGGRDAVTEHGVQPRFSYDGCDGAVCLLSSFREMSANLPEYNGFGPNSNTFANQLLNSCGYSGDFPFNAYGY